MFNKMVKVPVFLALHVAGKRMSKPLIQVQYYKWVMQSAMVMGPNLIWDVTEDVLENYKT